MNREIHEAFVTAPHKIGGVWLQPYSAAHAFALEAAQWTIADLGTGRGILRFLDIVSRPVGPDCLPKDWPRKGPSVRLQAFALAYSLSPAIRAATDAAVHEYLRDCLTTAEAGRPKSTETAEPLTGNNLVLRVVAGMRMGLTEHRAWSMPLAALNTYLLHRDVMEHPDKVKILDPIEDDYFAQEFQRRFANG